MKVHGDVCAGNDPNEHDHCCVHHSSGTRHENVMPREAVVNESDYLKTDSNASHHQNTSANGSQEQDWAMKGKLSDYANVHARDCVHHVHVHAHANDPVQESSNVICHLSYQPRKENDLHDDDDDDDLP